MAKIRKILDFLGIPNSLRSGIVPTVGEDLYYVEVNFHDGYSICIRSEIPEPSKVQLVEFLKRDMWNMGYTPDDIWYSAEIPVEAAYREYDLSNEKMLPILRAT